MFRHFKFGVMVVGAMAAVICTSSAARADMISFDNTCGDAMWHTCCDCMTNMKCNNWSVPASPSPICPAVPGATDDVTIDSDCSLEASMTGTALTLAQSNGTFTCNGSLSIADEATFDGPFVWNSGEVNRSGGASGQHVICNGGLSIQGADAKTLGFFGGILLTNTGAATWSGDGDWTIGRLPNGCCPSIVENSTGATFEVQNDASILQDSFGVGEFDNAGTLTKSSSGLSEWAVNLVNTGTVHIEDGELRLTRGGSLGGTWTIDSGAELGIAGNFFSLEPGVVIDGRAVVKNSGTNPGISVDQDVTINDLTIASDGKLGGSAILSIAGTLVNEADSMTNEAGDPNVHLHILAGGTFEANGTNAQMGQVDLEGEMHLPTGAATGCFNQFLNIMPGGVLTIDDDATYNQVGLVPKPLENHGTIRKPATGGEATIANYFNDVLNNYSDGTISVEGGTLRVQNPFSSSGTIDIAAGAEYSQGFWATYHDGTTITGDGFFHINQAQNNFVDANFELVVPRFRMSGNGGSGHGIHGMGDLKITQEGDLQGGYFETPNVTFGAGSVVNVSGPNFTGGNVVFENSGTFNLVNQSFGFGQFHNHADGVVDIQSSFSFLNWFSNGPCSNAGLFVKSAGGDANVVCSVTNTGTFRAESGRMVFPNDVNTLTQDDGVTELAGGGIVVKSFTLNGGVLKGTGDLSANVTNNGASIEPGASPGILNIVSNAMMPTIAGDFTQGAAGKLVIEVGGLAPGTDHDQLVVAGTASLDGTLELKQFNAFVPADGDTIAVLTASSIPAGFANVTVTGFPSSISATAEIDNNAIVVTFANDGTSNNPGNSNDNSNANDNTGGNTNDNTSGNTNTNSNGNDNTGTPDTTPMAGCGAGTCGTGAPPLLLAMMLVWGGSRRRRRRRRVK